MGGRDTGARTAPRARNRQSGRSDHLALHDRDRDTIRRGGAHQGIGVCSASTRGAVGLGMAPARWPLAHPPALSAARAGSALGATHRGLRRRVGRYRVRTRARARWRRERGVHRGAGTRRTLRRATHVGDAFARPPGFHAALLARNVESALRAGVYSGKPGHRLLLRSRCVSSRAPLPPLPTRFAVGMPVLVATSWIIIAHRSGIQPVRSHRAKSSPSARSTVRP